MLDLYWFILDVYIRKRKGVSGIGRGHSPPAMQEEPDFSVVLRNKCRWRNEDEHVWLGTKEDLGKKKKRVGEDQKTVELRNGGLFTPLIFHRS